MDIYQLVISFCIYTFLSVQNIYGLTCTCGNIEEKKQLDCQCETVNSIQWYLGDTGITRCVGAVCIPSSVSGYSFSHTGSTYKITISNFSYDNCKKYTCKDQQTQNTDIFPRCPVLTMTKPVSDDTINIVKETTEEFQCEIRSGYPAGTVEWFTDSKTPDDFDDDVKITVGITNSSRTSSTDNQEYITTSTLSFSASRSDTGNRIYCKATNKPEQTPLISQKKPLINVLWLSCKCGNIQENQPLECQCGAVSDIVWYYDGTQLTTCVKSTCVPSSVLGYTFSHTGSTYNITISNFSFNDCKKYSCTDQRAQLKDIFPYCPVLTMTKPVSDDDTINIAEDTIEEFQCEIRSGYPAGTVEWFTDSKTPDDFDDDVKITADITYSSITSSTDNEEYITTSTLSFSASRSDTGNRIYCKATNKPEQTPLISQKKPLVNVLYIPDIPTNFRQLQASLSTIQIGWEPGLDGGLSQNFRINYRKDSEQLWTSVKVKDYGETAMNYTVRGLEDDTKYHITIYAFNNIGKSDSRTILASTEGCTLSEVKEFSAGVVIGAAIGGIVVGIFVGAVAMCVFRRFVNDTACTKHCPKKRKAENYTQNDDTVMEDVHSRGSDTIRTLEYEHLGDKRTGDVYSTLTPNQDQSVESKSYENVHLPTIQPSD